MEVVEKRAQEKNAPLTVLHAKDISKLDGVEIGKHTQGLFFFLFSLIFVLYI